MPNENTAYLNLPLPHPDNLLEGDVFRLRDALVGLDTHASENDVWHKTAGQATDALATNTARELTLLANRATNLESGKVNTADPRLTNARPPTSHAASHKTGGADALKASDIGGVSPDQLPRIDGLSLVFDGGVWKVNESWLAQKAPQPAPVYAICEFKNWFEQNPPPGWLVRNGAVLANANTAYPKLWEYLHNAANTWKCKTLAQWNSLSSAAGGVGGVPFFVVDDAARTIKLPDTRGDYERAAGSSYLQAVGAWHGDAFQGHLRNIVQGDVTTGNSYNRKSMMCMSGSGSNGVTGINNAHEGDTNTFFTRGYYADGAFGPPRFAMETRCRSYATLGCVYVGLPT